MPSPAIGGVTLGPFFNRAHCGGRYQFHRQKQQVSGALTPVNYGEQWAEWDWDYLSVVDFNALRSLWQGNPGNFDLWSDDEKATAVHFSAGVMYEPKHAERVSTEYFVNVHVEFHGLIPLQA